MCPSDQRAVDSREDNRENRTCLLSDGLKTGLRNRCLPANSSLMKPVPFIASLIFLAALCSRQQIVAQSESTNTQPGPAVGTKAPGFTLQGQDGQDHALADFLKKGKVALVFFRSAGW